MTPHFDFVALAPVLIVVATMALVLITDLFLDDDRRTILSALSFVGCAGAFVITAVLGANGHRSEMFSGGYVVDSFSLLAQAFFTSCAALVFLFGLPEKWKGEYCQVMLASVAGMMALASARDLLIFFVSFELFALPGYLLTGWNKKTVKGAEAAVKYYLLGAVATALMLYGISFLYGLSGSTLFVDVAESFTNGGDQIALARISVFLVLVGMALKVSAVPFHFWTPDAYQGAPIPVAAFLSVVSKIAGFVALLEVVNVALPTSRTVWAPLLFGLAIASMVVGNLVALRQQDIVRLLAYSAIAQSGYILIPLAVAHGAGVETKTLQTTFEYLLIYAAANLGAFATVIAVARSRNSTDLATFNGLFHRSPALATVLSIFVLSLAGIPPLGGWFAKFVVIRDAVSVQSTSAIVLAVVAALTTAIGFVYYLGLVRRLWLDPVPEPADTAGVGTSPVSPSLVVVFAVACTMVVVTGVLPGVVTHVGGWSSLLK